MLAEGVYRVTLQKRFYCINCSLPFAWFFNKSDVTFFVQLIIFFASMIQMLLIACENYNSMTISFSTIPYLIRAETILCRRKRRTIEKVKTWLRKRSTLGTLKVSSDSKEESLGDLQSSKNSSPASIQSQ